MGNDYWKRSGLKNVLYNYFITIFLSDMKKQKKFLSKLIFLLVIFFLIFLFIIKPVLSIKKEFNNLKLSLDKLKNTFKKNDIDLLEKEFKSFKKDYQEFQRQAQRIYWLSFIPYVADFKNGVEAGNYYLKAGEIALEAIKPYADLIGFQKNTGSFVEKSAEDRLKTAILTLDKMLYRIDEISKNLVKGEAFINKIDPNRYPRKIGNFLLREKIENTENEILSLTKLFVDAKPLLKNLPEIFGVDKEKTYLILFQNDKELRATGGFLTSYAIFKIKEAKITIEKSEDIYDLDNSIANHPSAPREIVTYHLGVNRFYLRDSNLSPDFPTSIKLFNNLYNQSPKKVDYDGIIAIDTKILVDLLEIFGDTKVDEIVFSSRIDPRCDCPSAIYTLFDIVDRPTPYLRDNRKGILGRLMYALFYKAIGFSPSQYWGKLFNQMFKNLEEKHILVYFPDQKLQKAIEALDYGGRISNVNYDYLHINNVNFAGAKSNMFVFEEIESKTSFAGKKIKRELVITYKNPYPHSDCNLERGNLCLNATLRNWLRIYVPQGAKLISFKGSEKPVEVYNDLNKTVFEGFLKVNPLGMAKVIIEYQLPERVSPDNYRLLIQKQPGTKNQKLTVTINNRKIYQGILEKDKEFKN